MSWEGRATWDLGIMQEWHRNCSEWLHIYLLRVKCLFFVFEDCITSICQLITLLKPENRKIYQNTSCFNQDLKKTHTDLVRTTHSRLEHGWPNLICKCVNNFRAFLINSTWSGCSSLNQVSVITTKHFYIDDKTFFFWRIESHFYYLGDIVTIMRSDKCDDSCA